MENSMKRPATLLFTLLGMLWAGLISARAAAPLPEPGEAAAPVTLQMELAANGATLLSIPLDFGTLDVGQRLEKAGLSPLGIHGWSAKEQRYVPLRMLRPGEGFLLVRRGPSEVPIQGKRIVADTVELPLETGWNLIGVPYETGVPLDSLRIKLNGEVKSFKLATEKKWIGGVNTLIDGQSLPVVADGKALLSPWRGYWLYAYQPCLLQIPSAQTVEKSKGGGKTSGKR
jgi:hypothetical protein